MIGATPLLVAVLALGAPTVKNAELHSGIQLYKSENYAEALNSLTRALDIPSNSYDRARIHLYIGLIQHRYKLKTDAEDSFKRALEEDPEVKLPKSAPDKAKEIFMRIRRARYGDDPVEAPRPKKKPPGRGAMSRPRDDDGRDDPIAPPDPPPVRLGATASATIASAMAAYVEGGRGEELGGPRGLTPPAPLGRPSYLPPAGELEHPRTSPVAAWVSIGVGVAAVATGITFGVLADKNGNDAQNEKYANRSYDLHQTAVKQRTAAIVSFGVSGAALGLAVVLLLTN